ncbi:MauE/DoxX family redox-associated membrane protein [Sphingobacterium gobiense]|nr:MauE/DoxX family redox-associated membrane protein [Sphingobacterium gobiense]
MKNIREIIVNISRILLISLWAYTAAMKLGNMERNLDSMHKQFFPTYIGDILAYLIPVMALVTVAFLLYRTTTGLWFSIALLASFSVFIIIAFADIFPGQTCACAGIFPRLGYVFHLGFNIIMLGIALGLILYNKQTRGEAENRYQSRPYKLFYKQHD